MTILISLFVLIDLFCGYFRLLGRHKTRNNFMLGSPYSRSESPFAPTPELWHEATEPATAAVEMKKPQVNRPSSIFEPSRLMELSTTCHGSRILQEELKKMSKLGDSLQLNKVANTVLSSNSRLLELCMDKFGNYFVQVLLTCVDAKMLARFASALTTDAGPVSFAKLCVHPFGSHVMQVLIESSKDNRLIAGKIAESMIQNIVFIATDFLGSICMAQAVKSLPTGNKLLSSIAPLSKELAMSRHGHTVLIETLEKGSSQTLGAIEKILVDNLEDILSSDFGFRVVVHALELEKAGKVSPKHSRVRLFVRAVELNQVTFKLIDYIIKNFEDHEAVQLELIPRIIEIVKAAGHQLPPQDG